MSEQGDRTGYAADASGPTQEAPLQPVPAAADPRPWRRDGWFVALWVIVLLQLLVLVAVLGVLVVTVGFFFWPMSAPGGVGLYDPTMPGGYYDPIEERYYQDSMVADDAAVEIGRLIADDDVEAYVALYDPEDPHADIEEARSDFDEVAERVDAPLDFSAEWVDIFEDTGSGETIARVELSGYDTMSGPVPGTRITVYLVIDDGEWSPTGLGDRDLAPVW